MNEKLSERMREYLFRLSEREPVTMPEVGWPDEVAALEAKLEAMTGRIDKAVDYIRGEDDPDAPGKPWAIEHILDILDPAQEAQPE